MSTHEKAPAATGASAVEPTGRTASYTAPTPPTTDRPGWTAAKIIGDAGEHRAAQVLRGLGLLVQQQRGHAPYDLAVNGRIEIKTDLRAVHTGNVAVEVQYRGRLSGINTSTATGWCFVVADELFLCPIGALRDLLKRGNYRRAQAGENAIVALVPLADVRRIARSIRIGEARP